MQLCIRQYVICLMEFINCLEQYIQQKLFSMVNVSDVDLMIKIVFEMSSGDFIVFGIVCCFELEKGIQLIDQEWLCEVFQLLAKLKNFKWKYIDGLIGKGCINMGMFNFIGCIFVWGSIYLYNFYLFLWANYFFQDFLFMVMGVFEGYMAKMVEGFKIICKVELMFDGKYDLSEYDFFFIYFNWKQFIDEEWLLCLLVVVLGGDGVMYDIGF